MSKMVKSMAAMAGATLISRLLGLVREMAYARLMGNGWVASSFLLAFQIPNLFRRLLGEGALTAAFIPIFKEKQTRAGEAEMWRTANAVVSGLVVVASLVVAGVMAGVTVVMWVWEFPPPTALMLSLLRVMFPYTLLVCFAAICVGMLNAQGRFFVPALGAAALNVVMILSAVVVAPRMEGGLPGQVYALAWGVVVAGLAQALFQIPDLMRNGWRYRWVTPWRDPDVGEVVRRMIPAVVGVAAFQLNILVTQGFAFFLGETVVASFQYAVRLMELPQGLIGVSLATYLLPTLSGLVAEKRYEEFGGALMRGLSMLSLLNLLAGVLLLVLAEPIVRLLFEGGMFRASATESVAFALRFMAPGLVALSATSILARAYYAMGDTRVPMQIGVFCLALNAVLSVMFAMGLREGGLALANTLTSGLQAALLGYGLKRKLRRLSFGTFWEEFWRLALAAVGMGVVAWGVSVAWEMGMGREGLGVRMGGVAVPGLVALAGYWGVMRWIRVPAYLELVGALGRRRGGDWGKPGRKDGDVG